MNRPCFNDLSITELQISFVAAVKSCHSEAVIASRGGHWKVVKWLTERNRVQCSVTARWSTSLLRRHANKSQLPRSRWSFRGRMAPHCSGSRVSGSGWTAAGSPWRIAAWRSSTAPLDGRPLEQSLARPRTATPTFYFVTFINACRHVRFHDPFILGFLLYHPPRPYIHRVQKEKDRNILYITLTNSNISL